MKTNKIKNELSETKENEDTIVRKHFQYKASKITFNYWQIQNDKIFWWRYS